MSICQGSWENSSDIRREGRWTSMPVWLLHIFQTSRNAEWIHLPHKDHPFLDAQPEWEWDDNDWGMGARYCCQDVQFKSDREYCWQQIKVLIRLQVLSRLQKVFQFSLCARAAANLLPISVPFYELEVEYSLVNPEVISLCSHWASCSVMAEAGMGKERVPNSLVPFFLPKITNLQLHLPLLWKQF